MSVFIRQADLERDRDLLISTLFNYLTPLSDVQRFRWLYSDNPQGPALVWLAIDDMSGKPVGASAAFPREIQVNGKKKSAWVLGDFCVSGEHRSLGPALQLQRATLRGIEASGAELCYDFPSHQMTAIYKRMGISPVTDLVRLTKPLTLAPQIKKATGSDFLAKTVGGVSKKLLSIVEHRPRPKKNTALSISLHKGECAEEFSELAEKLQSQGGISLYRSAEYLNWRYLRHPNVHYQILTARKGNELWGYVIFTCDTERAEIAESCAVTDETLGSLVNTLIQHLRRTSVKSLNTFVTVTDPRKTFFEKSGFWTREATPMMVYWPSERKKEPNHCWLFSQGDRDS